MVVESEYLPKQPLEGIMGQPDVDLGEYLVDEWIAKLALDAGEAVFNVLYGAGITAGPKVPDALHMRVGTVVNGEFVQWGERTIGDGNEFSVNTEGKAMTAAAYGMNSDEAFARYGDSIPDGPQRWTGGVFVSVHTKFDDGIQVMLDPNVAACSGVQGEIDRAVSAAIGNVAASLLALREKARHASGA